MHDEQLIAAVIEERDEFEDLDLVLPHRTPFTIRKTDFGLVRPFFIRHNDEEIMVTTNKITEHFKTKKPVHINFQRYIPGRPNLLTLPLIPVQEDKSLHFQAGALFHFLHREICVWSFEDNYPGVIEVDCKNLSPNMAIKIGDIEKLLPHGMFLHKSY